MASMVSFISVTALLLGATNAQTYKIGSKDEILNTARTLAFDGMGFYKGNETGETPGLLPGPPPVGDYYWWEGGAMMGLYVNYWYLTGDESYNKVVREGMVHQQGQGDFQPLNITAQLGNDDQGIWGMAAMLAAESKFPDPSGDNPRWIELVQGVFEAQTARWNMEEVCGGGLRWQIPLSNMGYDYKNTFSNGVFFNLGARLARYTGNDTYAKQAAEVFEWLWDIQYIDHDNWAVYDGSHVDQNCTDLNRAQFSTNSAMLLNGAAYMYNHTGGDEVWKERLDELTDATLKTFFPDNVAVEVACEDEGTCTADMHIFKGLTHHWLASATQVAPYLGGRVRPVLRDSAEAAVKQCTGGDSGRACGFYWSSGKFANPEDDGTTGAGEALSVLSAVSGLLVDEAPGPAVDDGVNVVNDDNGGEGGKGASGGEDESGAVGGSLGVSMLAFSLLVPSAMAIGHLW